MSAHTVTRKNRFLAACAGEPVDTVPIWLMRQAGRYLPEYQATRQKAGDFLTLCTTPELAVEVTLQPVHRLGVDAAILFSDILLPLRAMGMPLSFTDEGPRLQPLGDEAAIDALRVLSPDELPEVLTTIRLLRRELSDVVPLIGFAGAPFTLLTYAVEGHTSKQFIQTKKLLFAARETAHLLLRKLTATVIGYLQAQVEAGAQAIQIFDSWVGILGQGAILTVTSYSTRTSPVVRGKWLMTNVLGSPLATCGAVSDSRTHVRSSAGISSVFLRKMFAKKLIY